MVYRHKTKRSDTLANRLGSTSSKAELSHTARLPDCWGFWQEPKLGGPYASSHGSLDGRVDEGR